MPVLDPTEDNLSDSTPAAPSGKQNVKWQADPVTSDPRNISAYPQPATASLEGTIMLAEDLGNTADLPKVVGIQGHLIDGGPTDGDVLKYSSSSGKWEPTPLLTGGGSSFSVAVSFADQETPGGTINGSNVTFTLLNAPTPAQSLQLFLNGQLLKPGGVDYTLAGSTITMATAPVSGDVLLAWYLYTGAAAGFGAEETPGGTLNGSNVTFTLLNAPTPAQSLQLFLNGQLLKPGGVDYTLAGSTITMATAPVSGDVLLAWYRYTVAATVNFADEETPGGTLNGSNVTLTLAHSPSPAASLQLFLNGQLLKAGGVDYTLSGSTITMVTAPVSTDILLAWYRY